MTPSRAARTWQYLLVAPVVLGLAGGAASGAWFWLHPLNLSPWDRTWGLVTLLFSVVLGLTAWVRGGRLTLAAVALTGLVLGTAGVVGAGVTGAVLATVWIVALGLGLGDLLLSRLAPAEDLGAGERAILAAGLGLGAVSLGVLGLGLCGWLEPNVIWPVMLAVTAVVARHAHAAGAHRFPARARAWVAEWWRSRAAPFHALAAGALLLCLAGGLVWALAPSVWYDELNYQAAASAVFAREGRVVDLPEEFRTVWAHNANMLFTLGAVLAGVPAIKLVSFALGLLGFAATAVLGTRLAGRRVGVLAALLVAALPVMSWELGVALVDLAVTFFVSASAIAVVRAIHSGRGCWAVVGGLLGGLALGTKLNAAPFVLVLGLALLVVSGARHGWKSAGVGAAVFGFAALGALLPWLARDWAWTGNPVFPFLNDIFRSPRWEGGATFNFKSYGFRKGLGAFLLLPWDLVVHPVAFGPGLGPGVAGALPWLAIPWLAPVLDRRRRWTACAVFAFAIASVCVWMGLAQYLRYLLPAFPALAVVAALNLEASFALVAERWRRTATILALALGLAYVGGSRLAHAVMMWEIPERFPVGVASGREQRDEFLSRAVREHDAFRFLDSRAANGAKVLTIGCPVRLYTHTRVFEVLHEPFELKDLARRGLTGGALANELARRGFGWLVVDFQNARDLRPLPSALRAQDFLAAFATLEFQRNSTAVYRLSGTARPRGGSAPPNLLANPGLEHGGPNGLPAGWSAYGRPVVTHGSGGHHSATAVRASRDNGLTQFVAVRADRLYTIGHWARADRDGQAARLQVNWLDSSSRIIEATIGVVDATPDWTWHSLAVSAPKGTVLAGIYASVHESSEVWFDDLCFVEGGHPDACQSPVP